MQVTKLASDPAVEFSSHEAWLRTVILSRLGNREEADEVLQEVALAAAHQSARGLPIQSAAPWLYRVALRQVLLLRRKQGRRRRLIASVIAKTEVNDACHRTAAPLQWILSQERGQIVRAALSTLGERDRQLLLLKYADGLSYDEIGQRLGVSASSVQSRLHRARGLLRQRLTPFEVSEVAEVTDKVNDRE